METRKTENGWAVWSGTNYLGTLTLEDDAQLVMHSAEVVGLLIDLEAAGKYEADPPEVLESLGSRAKNLLESMVF